MKINLCFGLFVFCIQICNAGGVPANLLFQNGEIKDGEIELIGGLLKIKANGKTESVAYSTVLELRLKNEPSKKEIFKEELVLKDGSRWVGTLGTIKDQSLEWNVADGKKMTFKLDKVKTIECGSVSQVKIPATKDSVVVVMDQGKIVSGSILYVTPLLIGIKTSFGIIRLQRDQIARLIFDRAEFKISQKDRSCLSTTQGDLLYGTLLMINSDGVKWTDGESTFVFTPNEISSIEIPSDKVMSLLDLKAIGVEVTPFLETVYEPSWNSSVLGSPLSFGGRPISRGVELHSRTKLTYAVPIGSHSFVSEIGLDEELGRTGQAIFKILFDGKLVKEKVLTIDQEPEWFNLKFKDVKEMEIILDFGERGSSGDFAILGNPRFLR